MFRSPTDVARRFYEETNSLVEAHELGIAGFHFFTFNELAATIDLTRS